jgi:hypothetical protein
MWQWLFWYLGGEAELAQSGAARLVLFHSAPPARGSWWLLVSVGILAPVLMRLFRKRKSGAGSDLATGKLQVWRTVPKLLLLSVLVLLLGQLSLRIDERGKPALALLVDVSPSSEQLDPYTAEELRQLQPLLPLSNPVSSTATARLDRLSVARSVLQRDQANWLRRLSEEFQVSLWGFADGLVEVSPPEAARETLADPAGDLPTQIQRLRTSGSLTNPRRALEQVLRQSQSATPQAVVVLTDGQATSSPEDSFLQAAQELKARGIPLFLVGLGTPAPPRDVRIRDVQVDRVGFLEEPVPLVVHLEGDDLAGERLKIQVLDRVRGSELAEQEIVWPAAVSGSLKVTLPVTPQQAGLWELEIRCVPVPGELRTANNSLVRSIWIRGDQLQVLLVDASPRWEYRHLKSTLERDPRIQLQTWLASADAGWEQIDLSARARLPETAAEWLAPDVIIWGDLPWSLQPGVATALGDFVGSQGGGLLIIPGPELLEECRAAGCPVWLPIASPGDHLPEESGRQLRITVAGRGAPYLEDFVKAESSLKTVGLMNPLAQLSLRPGALTLLESTDPAGPIPLLIEQRYGRGQSLWQNTEELWRLRGVQNGELSRRYWAQLIRYLGKYRIMSGLQGPELWIDRASFDPDEPITIYYRGNIPAPAHVELHHRQGEIQQVPLLPGSYPGEATARLSGLSRGSYLVKLPGNEPAVGPAARFEVTGFDPERSYQPLPLNDLKKAASLTGGRCLRPWELETLLQLLPRGSSQLQAVPRLIPLWNRWEMLLLVVSLLMLEWRIRT